MVTDGGMETDLIFHHGVDLPLFAVTGATGSATPPRTWLGSTGTRSACSRNCASATAATWPTW
jgi:hypothetical protein